MTKQDWTRLQPDMGQREAAAGNTQPGTPVRLAVSTDVLALIDFCLADLARQTHQNRGRLDERAFLLVPESLKADLERRYLAQHDVGGLMLAEVLSFNRFAHRVFSIAGGLAISTLDQIGKLLLLQKLLHDHDDQFKLFRRLAGYPGYTQELAKVLGDLKRYQIDAALLADIAAQTPPSLTRDKLADFSVLQTLFEQQMEEHGWLDQELDLDRLTRMIDREPLSEPLRFLERAHIWIAGFADRRLFTPLELNLIRSLGRHLKSLTITFCTDISPNDTLRQDLYHPGLKTLNQVRQIFPTAQIIRLPETISRNDRKLQELLLGGSAASDPAEKPAAGPESESRSGSESGRAVTLMQARDRRAEWSFIAGEIKRLIAEEGYLRRDIGLALCDGMQDLSLQKSVFREFGLSSFLNERVSLRRTPVYRYLETFFRLSEARFDLPDVIAFLRSGLVSEDEDAVDRFENCCLKYGIRYGGQLLNDDFFLRDSAAGDETVGITPAGAEEARKTEETEQDGAWPGRLPPAPSADGEMTLPQALSFRQDVLDLYFAAARKLRTLRSGGEKARFLLRFLAEGSRFRQNLADLSDSLRAGTEEDEALTLARSWNVLVELLEQCDRLFDRTELNQQAFRDTVLGALAGQVPEAIPVGLDRIRLGSPEQMMYYDCKVLFIAGATAETFPASSPPEGFLHNTEREWIEHLSGRTLPNYRRDQIESAQVVAAQLLTRARERLYFSAPTTDRARLSPVQLSLEDECNRDSAFARAYRMRSILIDDPCLPDQRWLDLKRARRYLAAGCEQPSRSAGGQAEEMDTVRPGGGQDSFGLNRHRAYRDAASLPRSKEYWRWALAGQDSSPAAGLILTAGNGKDIRQNPADPLDQLKPKIWLRRDLAARSLALTRSFSASALQRYRSCPYSYYAERQLKLRERPLWNLDARARGTLIHAMMELALNDFGAALAETAEAERDQTVQLWFERWNEPQFYRELYSRSVRYAGLSPYAERSVDAHLGRRIRRYVRTALWFNTGLIHPQRFMPAVYEWSFPAAGIETPLLRQDGQSFPLTGTIDRVDLNQQGEYRIYDYKTGAGRLDPARVYHGLDLQPGFYQAAWQLNHPAQEPEQIAYLTFENTIDRMTRDYLPPRESLSERQSRLKLLDAIQADSRQLKAVGRHTLKRAEEILTQIAGGDISPNPRVIGQEGVSPDVDKAACRYCIYHDICRLDQRLLEQRTEVLITPADPHSGEVLKGADLLAAMTADDAPGSQSVQGGQESQSEREEQKEQDRHRPDPSGRELPGQEGGE